MIGVDTYHFPLDISATILDFEAFSLNISFATSPGGFKQACIDTFLDFDINQ